MKPNDLDQTLRDALSGTAPAEIHEGAQRRFDDFAAKLGRRPAPSWVRERRPLWWLGSGLGLAGAAGVILLAASFFFTPEVSWAQVVEKFHTLRFCNITLFCTSSSDQPPEKLEIWVSQDHRCRVHYRGLITFGRDGKLVRVLRATTGEELDAEAVRAESLRGETRKSSYPLADFALRFPAMLSTTDNLSIAEVMRFFGGTHEPLQPVPNLDASLAPDMQVFDFTFAKSSDWVRLWVLKKSELPIRARSWSPVTDEQVEAVFDYFTQMPAEAFDPEKVEAAIASKQGAANKVYALLKDPGKRPLTAEDSFAQIGYQLPNIESIGRTEDGVVWVISKDRGNQTPAGELHFGWGALTDNLGQEYPSREFIGQDLSSNRTLEYYVPLDYHGAYQKPQTYTLTCEAGDDNCRPGAAEQTVIGSVPVKEWKDNTPMPQFPGSRIPNAREFTVLTLGHLCQLKDWDRFDRLAATIPGEPEEGNLALFRDIWRAEKLDHIGRPKEAMMLRARIYSMLKPLATDWEFQGKGMAIASYVTGLLREGKHDEARKVANESVTAFTGAKRYNSIYYLLLALHDVGMGEADARQFFDTDVFETPLVKDELERNNFFRDEFIERKIR